MLICSTRHQKLEIIWTSIGPDCLAKSISLIIVLGGKNTITDIALGKV